MTLSTLGTSCRWNYTIPVFLWLSSFIYHVFKIHPYCTMYQNFFSILGLIILHCMQIIHFVYPFTCGWAFGLFLLLDYCEKCCYEHEYKSIYLSLCFHFFEYMPRSDFWRNCHTVFHSNYNFTFPPRVHKGYNFSIFLLILFCLPSFIFKINLKLLWIVIAMKTKEKLHTRVRFVI